MEKSGREERLSAINEELSRRGIKPLDKLGDATLGEIEILGITEIYDHSKEFFIDVKYRVAFPGGRVDQYTVRSNANGDGAVFVPIINGQFAVVKQWRLPLGRWMYEVPRGFAERIDHARVAGVIGTLKIGDLPLQTLIRELTEEVMADAVVTSVCHLGNVAQDSGAHTAAPAFYMIQIAVDQKRLTDRLKGSERLQEIKVQLWSAERVKQELGVKICDVHSLTALTLAMSYIERLPRL